MSNHLAVLPTTTAYRSSPKLSVQAVSVTPPASRSPMPPLQSLSLRSDAYSPEPLVARSVRISSTRLQTQPPTVRPGPRPLGPAIPSEIPLADVTVHPTWRPPGVAGNISATDLPPAASYSDRMATPVEDDPSIVTPSAQRGDAVAGKPARVTSPPAAPSVPPSWLSATSRRLNHSEDATLVHSLHSCWQTVKW